MAPAGAGCDYHCLQFPLRRVCVECGECAISCPTGALEFDRVPNQEITTSLLSDAEGEVVMIGPDRKVPDGGRLY